MSFSEEAAMFAQLPLQPGLIPQPGQSLGSIVFPQLPSQVFLPQPYQDYEAFLLQQKFQQQAQVRIVFLLRLRYISVVAVFTCTLLYDLSFVFHLDPIVPVVFCYSPAIGGNNPQNVCCLVHLSIFFCYKLMYMSTCLYR